MTTNVLRPPNADFSDDDPAKYVSHWYAATNTFEWSDSYVVKLQGGQTLQPRDLTEHISKPGASIGDLDILPVEIMIQILDMLDLESLRAMRVVSSKGRNLVESLRTYQKLIGFADHSLRLLHATHATRFISASHLYATLLDPQCCACGSYGHYVFLFTGDRCCFWCLYNDGRFSIMTLASAASEFKVSKDFLRTSCNVLHSLPGQYQVPEHFLRPALPPDTIGRKHTELVSTVEALHFCSSLNRAAKPERRSARLLSTPSRRDPAIASCLDKRIPPYRGMGACLFPYLNPRVDRYEKECWCRGCDLAFKKYPKRGLHTSIIPDDDAAFFEARRKRETAFTDETFLAHFYECENAQKVWNFVVDQFRRGRGNHRVDWSNVV